jgi:hypothetical protein
MSATGRAKFSRVAKTYYLPKKILFFSKKTLKIWRGPGGGRGGRASLWTPMPVMQHSKFKSVTIILHM